MKHCFPKGTGHALGTLQADQTILLLLTGKKVGIMHGFMFNTREKHSEWKE